MRSEVANYQPQIGILASFTEGRLDGPALEAALASEEMRTLLSVFEDPRYPASTNDYRRLQKQDRVTLRGLVNSEGIIERFLQTAGVDFRPARRYRDIHSLILKAVPEYLDPPLEFMIEKIIPLDAALNETQKRRLIKERLKECFRYLEKPPKWIQSPDWPITDGKPLVFIGQIAIGPSDLFHDTGAAYVFFDPADGRFETVAQFY